MNEAIRLVTKPLKSSRRLAALLAISLIFVLPPVWASDKKGIGLWDLHAPERIVELNVAWYYTWQPKPIEGAPPEEFVPMLFGGNKLEDQLKDLKSSGKSAYLLVINEPDVKNQANMSVDETARLWPDIENLADKISTPAPATVMSPWFDRFYRIANNRGLKTDFMAIHLYTPPDVVKFLSKLDEVYEKYKMPIWITEFAVADWDAASWNCKSACRNRYSEDEVLAFMKAVLPELERRPYIVRYAWFGAGKYSLMQEGVRTSRLYEKDGKLTPLGKYYAHFQ